MPGEWFAIVFGTNGKPLSALWSETPRAIGDRAAEFGAVQAYATGPGGERESWSRPLDGGWKRERREAVL